MGKALTWLGAEGCKGVARELIERHGGKVTREDGQGQLICRCPLHEDTEPSAAYSFAKDVFHCSAGCLDGDLIALFGELERLDQVAAFQAFKERFAPGEGQQGRDGDRPARAATARHKPPQEPPAIPEEEWLALPELPEKWLRKLEAERGWSRAEMKARDLRLYVNTDRADRPKTSREGRVAIPVRDAVGRLVDIRLYGPGQKVKIFSYRMGDKKTGQKFGGARAWPMGGA